MRKKIIFYSLLSIITTGGALSQSIKLPAAIAEAEKQTHVMLTEIPKAKAARSGATVGVTPGSEGQELVSPRTLDSSKLKLVSSRDWTSGFFPGELWFLYEFTGKAEWKTAAEQYTAPIEREKTNGGTHDMGFKIYCSFGTGYRLTNNPHYKEVIVQSAKTLSRRFNSTAGVIKSWDNRTKWKYPVIIDNMMNLELLFAATKLTGDSSYYKIAVAHANTTLANHFRSDNSSYHVVDYDTATGKVIQKTTHQGYADESAWSRGQTWGLYGYTMCYRFTKDKKYLAQAEKIAAYVLNHPNMPKDLVPYWDFNAPKIPNEQRDASAAAIIASGLYELSTYSKNGKLYLQKADKIVASLTNSYRSPIGENKGFILLHSTGSRPSNSEVDVPLSYGDYYYLEALLRSKKLKEKKNIFSVDHKQLAVDSKQLAVGNQPSIISSIAELQNAINKAKPGDVILLKKGVYAANEDIVVNVAGTKEKRIVIAAEETGAAEINGKGGFNLGNEAAYITIKGFVFKHLASKAKSSAGSSFCRWTDNLFETPGTGEYLTIAGSDHEVDHNTFQNKDSLG
ncbi:MAG TPA: chondroitinase-B domain-containing protein, partial [Chitinophagaceae bacterium]